MINIRISDQYQAPSLFEDDTIMVSILDPNNKTFTFRGPRDRHFVSRFMGHYHSEMQCNKCGRLDCRCPSQVNPDRGKWVVSVRAHRGSYEVIPLENMPWIERMDSRPEHFTSKELAIQAAPDIIKVELDAELQRHQERLSLLKRIHRMATREAKKIRTKSK